MQPALDRFRAGLPGIGGQIIVGGLSFRRGQGLLRRLSIFALIGRALVLDLRGRMLARLADLVGRDCDQRKWAQIVFVAILGLAPGFGEVVPMRDRSGGKLFQLALDRLVLVLLEREDIVGAPLQLKVAAAIQTTLEIG